MIKKSRLDRVITVQAASPNSDVDLLVNSGLHGLRSVCFSGDVQKAVGKEIDLPDVTQVFPDPLIDREIQQTGAVLCF